MPSPAPLRVSLPFTQQVTTLMTPSIHVRIIKFTSPSFATVLPRATLECSPHLLFPVPLKRRASQRTTSRVRFLM